MRETQWDLFGPIPAPFARGSETSEAAAKSIEPVAGTQRAKVLAVIRYYGGLTDQEIQNHLCLDPSSERPRRQELQKAGLIEDSGLRRKTRSGMLAVVWVAK